MDSIRPGSQSSYLHQRIGQSKDIIPNCLVLCPPLPYPNAEALFPLTTWYTPLLVLGNLGKLPLRHSASIVSRPPR